MIIILYIIDNIEQISILELKLSKHLINLIEDRLQGISFFEPPTSDIVLFPKPDRGFKCILFVQKIWSFWFFGSLFLPLQLFHPLSEQTPKELTQQTESHVAVLVILKDLKNLFVPYF